MLLCQKLGDTI